MAKDEDIDQGPTTDTPTTPPPPAIGYPEHDGGGGRSSTDFVAAVTVAILAVIIVITCVLVARAIRKRRRARQGTRMDQRIPAISTGVMGTRTYEFLFFSVISYNNDIQRVVKDIHVRVYLIGFVIFKLLQHTAIFISANQRLPLQSAGNQ